MPLINAAEEDWPLLLSFFPPNWKQLATSTDALKGLRQDKSVEGCLRLLLMHLGCGLSMRETVARAQEAGLANLSDVALLKRVRKSEVWLFELCRALFEERELGLVPGASKSLRLIDATEVKEPGKTGSLWRIHYSLRWPGWKCDFFKVTPVEGKGTGESLQHFPLQRGDIALADRGYCHASGIHHAAKQQSSLIVRLNPDGIILQTKTGAKFPLLAKLKAMQQTGAMTAWGVWVPYADQTPVKMRLCMVRKSKAAIALAHKKLLRKASKMGSKLQPRTLIYAEYVMVLTTLPEGEFGVDAVLQTYRFRWQIELVFKRFKQVAQLGHIPKHDPDTARAWLYGKLFVALLTEKILQQARAFSPWGYDIQAQAQ